MELPFVCLQRLFAPFLYVHYLRTGCFPLTMDAAMGAGEENPDNACRVK